MDAVLEVTKADRTGDGYEEFSQQIQEQFAYNTSMGKHLFTTDVEGLFDTFLNALPEGEPRQHYTCHCCRSFVKRYGGLVVITEEGALVPVMWEEVVPDFFQAAVKAMRQKILKANVTGVFFSGEAILGTPEAGGFNHMHVAQPAAMVSNHLLRTAGQRMDEKRKDYQILRRSLAEFSLATIETALTLLQSEQLYRGERHLGVAEWFHEVYKTVTAAENEKVKSNLIWLAVASAPAGFTHVRSTMIGTLLTDIQDGLSFDAVKARFAANMDPSKFQRAQVAPTAGGVQQAERMIQQLGLEDSLARRYMAISEIPAFVWRPRTVATAKKAAGGVFANVATKQKAAAPSPAMTLPVTPMTWEKFQRTILPTADKIEVKAEQSNRFAALVTAVHPESKNILQWNNRSSWYYHGGADAEIQRRVELAGGRYHDNKIRASFMWYSYSDLDIHANAPYDGHIYFGDKKGEYGYLDVDMNVSNYDSLEPVENIRFQTALAGHYEFYIHTYTDRNRGHNPYKAEIEIEGKIYTFEGALGGVNSKVVLASFDYQPGVQPTIRGASAIANGTAWNLELGQFYPVEGIVKSPNLWDADKPAPHAGDHTFFVIRGCQDTEQGRGRGWFTEMLNPELREIRKTLDAYTAMTPIAAAEGEPACGLGFKKGSDWDVTLRVTTGTVVAEYKIERYD